MLEGVICLYKINSKGGMQRKSQNTIQMGRKFFPSENGNMVLTRSKDKKIISLTNFDKDDLDGQYFKICTWNIKLEQI